MKKALDNKSINVKNNFIEQNNASLNRKEKIIDENSEFDWDWIFEKEWLRTKK
ncbi:MAG: hypothetical protein ACFFA6_10520 [Promethearchaeota archaeon]